MSAQASRSCIEGLERAGCPFHSGPECKSPTSRERERPVFSGSKTHELRGREKIFLYVAVHICVCRGDGVSRKSQKSQNSIFVKKSLPIRIYVVAYPYRQRLFDKKRILRFLRLFAHVFASASALCTRWCVSIFSLALLVLMFYAQKRPVANTRGLFVLRHSWLKNRLKSVPMTDSPSLQPTQIPEATVFYVLGFGITRSDPRDPGRYSNTRESAWSQRR